MREVLFQPCARAAGKIIARAPTPLMQIVIDLFLLFPGFLVFSQGERKNPGQDQDVVS